MIATGDASLGSRLPKRKTIAMASFASQSPAAAQSSFFGMASRAPLAKHRDSFTAKSLDGEHSTCSDAENLTEWTWTGLLDGSKFTQGLSWGVSCLRTDCKENQDGWAVQVYAVRKRKTNLGVSTSPSFCLSFNHELSSLNSKLSRLVTAAESIVLPVTTSPDNAVLSLPGSPNVTGQASKEAHIGSATFVVLDGHGAGGRDASAAVEKAFDTVYSRTFFPNSTRPTHSDDSLDERCIDEHLSPVAMLEVVSESLAVGQKTIEALNTEAQRDFGTTCVSVTIVADMLVSTACGDSSALLFAFPPGPLASQKSPPLVIELSRRHSLEDKDELVRIQTEGRGRVIKGDGGVMRLIPSTLDYEEAKRRGLSINMGRSMGHAIFNGYGLSNATDYSFLSLRQIPKLLAQASRAFEAANGRMPAKCYRLPPLTYSACQRVIEASIASQSFKKKVSRGSEENKPPQNLSESEQNSFLRTDHHRSSERRRRPIATTSSGGAALEENGGNTRHLLKCISRRFSGSATMRATEGSTGKVGDIFLLLMSDGVTDVLSSSCIIDILKDHDHQARLKKKSFEPAAFALALTGLARERRMRACQRADNCTCLAVHLIAQSQLVD